MNAYANLSDVLDDCGCSGNYGANLKLFFNNTVIGKWITVRAETDANAPGFDYKAEMAAVAALPADALVRMALISNLSELQNSFFFIEKLEYFAYRPDESMLPNWQPNHFNPQVTINEKRLLPSLESDSPVGLVLPYCLPFEAPFNPLQSISVQARLLKNDNANVLRHVNVVSLATFRYK